MTYSPPLVYNPVKGLRCLSTEVRGQAVTLAGAIFLLLGSRGVSLSLPVPR